MKPLAFLVSGALFTVAVSPAVPGAAQGTRGETRVIIAVHMPTTDLQVTDLKYRVFFNKQEQKTIPITDFDFASNLADELSLALAADRRAQWRVATAAERESLVPLFAPQTWRRNTFPAPAVEGDRVMLVNAAYGAVISGMVKRILGSVDIRMADARTGRVLWKKAMTERTGLPDTLEDMQADNQKVLIETLNKVMELIAPKVRAHVVRQRL